MHKTQIQKKNTFPDYSKAEYINLDEYVKPETNGDVVYLVVIGSQPELDIYETDLLVVDRNKIPKVGDIVVVQCGDNALLFKYKTEIPRLRLATINGKLFSNRKPVYVQEFDLDAVWAVVTHIVKKVGSSGGIK